MVWFWVCLKSLILFGGDLSDQVFIYLFIYFFFFFFFFFGGGGGGVQSKCWSPAYVAGKSQRTPPPCLVCQFYYRNDRKRNGTFTEVREAL